MTTIGTTRIYHQTARVPLTMASVWNAVAPVSRLPSEILIDIFLYCARRFYYENWDDMGVPRWVNVSYVCSRWRYVALSCPTLWSYMFVACPRWTDASLTRSRELPLWVRVYVSPLSREMALEFMEQVTPHAERFREFRLNFQSDDAKVVLPMLSSRSAPLLCTLAITCRPIPHHWNQMDVDEEIEFDVNEGTQVVIDPHHFFNGDTPALRELRLRDYRTPWCSPTLSGLTVLRLRDLHYSVRPTIAELRVVLSRMPDLVRLHLENAIRGGFHGPGSLGAEQVHLPRLAHLLVSAPFSRVVRFLSCIDVPVTTQVRLGCRLETQPNGDDFPLFYALLSQRFSNAASGTTSLVPIRTLVMDNLGLCMSIFFSASQRRCNHRKCCSLLFDDCDCDIPLKVNVEWPPDTTHWRDLVVGICRSVPLASLENLILERCRLPSTLWLNIIWHLQGLRYIAFIGGDLIDVLILLSLSPRPPPEDVDRPTSRRTSQLFAPSLEELYLEGVEIPRVCRCGGNPSIHEKDVAILCDALARRRTAGHELKRLVINGSSRFTQKEVGRLKEVIPQVRVHDFARLEEEFEGCKYCRPEQVKFGYIDTDELLDGLFD